MYGAKQANKPSSLWHSLVLVLHFFPLIPDDFVTSGGVDEAFNLAVWGTPYAVIPTVEAGAPGEGQFFGGHQLWLKTFLMLINMVDIFSDEAVKYLVAYMAEDSRQRPEVYADLEINEIGAHVLADDDITEFVEVEVKYAPLMQLFYYSPQGVEKCFGKYTLKLVKRGAFGEEVKISPHTKARPEGWNTFYAVNLFIYAVLAAREKHGQRTQQQPEYKPEVGEF